MAGITDGSVAIINSGQSTQLRVGYDTSNYLDVQVGSAGDVTLAFTGGSGITVSGTLDVTGAVTLDVALDVAGNARIGSAGTPSDTLDVDGTANISGNTTLASGLTLDGTGTGTGGKDRIYHSSTSGMVFWAGEGGSSYDHLWLNNADQTVMRVPTGTRNLGLFGNLTVSGSGPHNFTGSILAGGGSNPFNAADTVVQSKTSGATEVAGLVAYSQGGTKNNRFLMYADEAADEVGFDISTSAGTYPGYVFRIEGTKKFTMTRGGSFFINETANTKMTIGLTINQGAADDEILALKSSDVAHGVTAFAETDTFAAFRRGSAASGGMALRALSEGTGAIQIQGIHTTDDTGKTTSASGAIVIRAFLKSGTGVADVGANGNLATIRNNDTTRFIFDAEGSAHADVEWTTFDRHDDLAVLEDMETLLAPGAVERRFGDVVQHDRSFFEREGLFHDIREVEPGRMRGMMNQTKMLMLHSGAIRQVGSRTAALESALREIVTANPSLPGAAQARALLEG